MAPARRTPVSAACANVVSPSARRTDLMHEGLCLGRRFLAAQVGQMILPGIQAEGAGSHRSQGGRSRILVRLPGEGPHSPVAAADSCGQLRPKGKSLIAPGPLAVAVAVPRTGKGMLISELGS